MSNVTYQQVITILQGWTGTTPDKWNQWVSTYNFVSPPPQPFPTNDDPALAHYIADNYTGPPIPT